MDPKRRIGRELDGTVDLDTFPCLRPESTYERDSFVSFNLNPEQNSLMWLLLLALALIVGEWFLYQKGRMP